MQGVYVDQDAHIVLVYAYEATPHKNDYSVYLNKGDSTDLAVATMTNDGNVSLQEVDVKHTGIYNGLSCIEWEDGSKWQRVQFSIMQYRLLTGRPYIPLSYLAWRIFRSMVTQIVTTLKGWGPSVARGRDVKREEN